jgi:AP-1 complex subunit gamma-1
VVSVDAQAIQRHRSTIVDCLKDHDISIRRRALDLVYALVNETNIRMLVRELLSFLATADLEFRADLTAKICMVTEKFAPTKKWHVDTILRVISTVSRLPTLFLRKQSIAL